MCTCRESDCSALLQDDRRYSSTQTTSLTNIFTHNHEDSHIYQKIYLHIVYKVHGEGKYYMISFRSVFFFRFSVRVLGMLPLYHPFFQGGCGLLGPNPVTQWAKAGVHPGWVTSSSQDPYWWQRWQLHIRSNSGVQYLAQGYFDM